MEAIYQLNSPSQLLTPCLLVYPEIIRSNLAETVRIAGDVARLRPHVKTHKTAEIVQLELNCGITKHKCATLAEAEMLAKCGVPDVLIAYQQVGPSIGVLANLVAKHRGTRFSTVVDQGRPLAALAAEFTARGLRLDTLVDIDSGMHRTGIAAGGEAIVLAQAIDDTPSLRFAGLHIYDGQNHQHELAARRAAVEELMREVWELVSALKQRGLAVSKLVCGGTPTFPVFAEISSPDDSPIIELSPGTCVLSDFNYGNDYRDLSGIRHAALLLTRVIAKPGGDRLTLDLGYKALASDPPADRRCHLLDLPDVKQVQHNEEHLMIETPAAARLEIGDVVYAIPAHICPTVALHSHLHVVENGNLTGRWKVAARDRIYSVA